MSDMKCPFCQQEMICGGTICHYNPDCPIHDHSVPTEVLELLERTHKKLEQSEICCAEWERQALDYKAENINLSDKIGKLETELECTRKALEIAVGKLKGIKAFYDDSYADPHAFVNWHIVAQRLANDADDAVKDITALEQKDVK